LIEEAVQSGTRLWKACEVIGITVRTYQRWSKDCTRGDARHGPRGKPANSLSEEEKQRIVAIATSEDFRELAPSQIVPILAEEGTYVASESSFYRVLRQRKLLAHRERSRPRQHHRPLPHIATGPNQVWSWDITYLHAALRGQFYYLYLLVDVWSRKIMAWEVQLEESSEIAAAMVAGAAQENGVGRDHLVIHSDNGGPMKGATLLATLQSLGILPSFSRPRVCDDNPYSEALFRTLKYRPEYPSLPFASLQEARCWVQGFVQWYNTEHRHSAIRFVTPQVRHAGAESQVLTRRKEVYEEAKRRNPSRWTGATRNWSPIAQVSLNPVTGRGEDVQRLSA
jgi:transposase InsO family protein